MGSLITVAILIICILLILVVLVQNSKGGGLASGFQATGQQFGMRRTTDFLEKATWGLASALIVLAIASSVMGTGPSTSKKEIMSKGADAPAAQTPAAPAQGAPAQPGK